MLDPGAIQARGGWPLGQVGPDSEGGWGCWLWIGWFVSETCVFQGAVCFLKESVNPAGGGGGVGNPSCIIQTPRYPSIKHIE